MFNQKGFSKVAIIIIVLILIGGGTIWYYFNQQVLKKPDTPNDMIGKYILTIPKEHRINLIRDIEDKPIIYSSPNNKRFAYIIKGVIKDEEGKFFIVVDGTKNNKGYCYDIENEGIQSFTFSPNSKNYAYIGNDCEGYKYHIILNGQEIKNYSDGIGEVVFSPDGKQLAYTVLQEEGWFFVINEKEHRVFYYSNISDFTFSPDSKNYAFVAIDEGYKSFIVLNGNKIGEIFDMFIRDGLIFSSDSKTLFYTIKVGNKIQKVVKKLE